MATYTNYGSTTTRKTLSCCIVIVSVLILSQLNYGHAVIITSCNCPRLPGYITYLGTCANQNELMVVKRTLISKTPNKNNAQFCAQTIQPTQQDCVQQDILSTWPVKSSCNGQTGQCMVSYMQDNKTLSTCPPQEGYVYGCLQYECVTNITSTGSPSPRPLDVVYLINSNNRDYEMGPSLHMMTTYYPSATSNLINQCTMTVPANVNVLIRIQDLRSDFIGISGTCPYYLYINTGRYYKQWCTDSTSWVYEEVRLNGTSSSGDQFIDVVFYSNYPSGQTKGAAWLTVETSGKGVSVQCGAGIPLHNGTGHSTRAPSTTTTITTTTTKTTTRQPAGPSSSTTKISSSSSTSKTTTATTTKTTTKSPGSSTTKQSQGPPGVSSSSARPSSTVPSSTSRGAVGPATTTGKIINPGSFTPGVPTPGVPLRDPNAVAAYTYSGRSVKPVAITVAVVVGGLILIAAIIMAFVWYFKLRHERQSDSGLTTSMHHGEEGIYEEEN